MMGEVLFVCLFVLNAGIVIFKNYCLASSWLEWNFSPSVSAEMSILRCQIRKPAGGKTLQAESMGEAFRFCSCGSGTLGQSKVIKRLQGVCVGGSVKKTTLACALGAEESHLLHFYPGS